MSKTIAVLAGDGIGPEVMTQSLRVLDTVGQQFGHQWKYIEGLVGGAAYDEFEQHCPDATLAVCQQADAILFGSVGGPVEQQQLAKWQNCEAQSILKIRKHFQFNVNLRPVILYPELAKLSPLRADVIAKGADILIYRELCGDLYFGGHSIEETEQGRIARDEAVYTEDQIASIAYAAFKAAEQRGGRLASVDKANVLSTSKLWRSVVSEIGQSYPNVELTHVLVDNCAMQVILDPSQFDVLLAPNMFGDIISDLAAALPGSLGLIPSASLNGEGFGLYEPSGGSAPSLTGKDIANPIAQLLSAAMMLEHSFAYFDEASVLRKAIADTLAAGVYTQDIAGGGEFVGTTAFIDAVITRLG